MTKKIKYALIGFGGIAEKRIVKDGFAFPRLQNAKLIGITDVNSARKQTAEKQNFKWYNSEKEIFHSENIDAVFIATPNSTHADLAKQALEAGKHVIVEKPMAAKSACALELYKLAKARGLSFAVDHMMTMNQLNIKAAEIIEDKTLGKISEACFHMQFLYGNTPEQAKSWRCSKVEEMGGPIGDVGSHCFYMAEYLFKSRITMLRCVYYPKTLPIVVEDGALISCVLENGINCNINVSFSSPRKGPGVYFSHGYEIYGENALLKGVGTLGQLSGNDDDPVKIRLEIENVEKNTVIKPTAPQSMYSDVISKHAQSILDKKPLSALDGLRNLLLCEAAHESAGNNGRIIKIKSEIL